MDHFKAKFCHTNRLKKKYSEKPPITIVRMIPGFNVPVKYGVNTVAITLSKGSNTIKLYSGLEVNKCLILSLLQVLIWQLPIPSFEKVNSISTNASTEVEQLRPQDHFLFANTPP